MVVVHHGLTECTCKFLLLARQSREGGVGVGENGSQSSMNTTLSESCTLFHLLLP